MKAEDVKTYVDKLSRDLSAKYELKSAWVSPTEATVSRTGVTGSIKITPTQVVVDLDLAFVLGAIKGTIESKIREELEKMTKIA